MVYKYETDECEIPFVDWTHRAYTPIPKATTPANGATGGSDSPADSDVNVTVSCDCEG